MTRPTHCPDCEGSAARARACRSCGAPAPDALLVVVRRALAGDFEVECEVGRGRTAVVYRARDARLGHRVAVKVLRPELAGTDAAARFLAVTRATAVLEHANVLPVYGAGERGGVRFVAARYVDGCSLERLRRAGGRLPAALACHVAALVARALECAHAAGVAHGDLRASHVLLDGARGHVVVTGFGAVPSPAAASQDVSRVEAHAEAHAEPHAEPHTESPVASHVAPELAEGAPPTPASDQYALGALVWELLTGAPPAAASLGTAADPALPAGLRVAVARMLAPSPEARWPRLGDVAAVLLRHAGSELAQQKELRRGVAALASPAVDAEATQRLQTSQTSQTSHVAQATQTSRILQAPQATPAAAGAPPAPRRARPASAAVPARPYVAASELRDIELPFRGDDGPAAREPAPPRRTARGDERPRAPAPRSSGRRRRAAAGVAAGLAVATVGALGASSVRGRGAAPPRPAADAPPVPGRATPPAPAPGPREGPTTSQGAAAGTPAPNGAPAAATLAVAGDSTSAASPPAVDLGTARVVVEGRPDSLAVGDSVRLRATLLDAAGAPLPRPAALPVRWRSADASRVQVSPAGWARATRAPRDGAPVTVTAYVGAARGRARLRVVPAPVPPAVAEADGTARPPNEPPPAPSAADADALVATFVAALHGRELAVVQRLLEAGGAASAAEATRWLRERRDFRAALAERGAVRDDGGALALDFRVTLAWRTRTLADLHRGGTAHAATPAFRATLGRDADRWVLRSVAPLDRFPP